MKNLLLPCRSLLLLVAAYSLFASTGQAALDVSVLNANIPVGGTGFIDVVITGSGDNVQSHSIELLITPNLGATTFLQFAFPQLISYATLPDYVYFGDSSNEFLGPPFPKDILNFAAGPSFLDLDSTDSGADVSVTTQRLLARLDVEHIVPFGTDPNTVLGDTFTVSIVQADFFDSGVNSVSINSMMSGNVSLNAAAVPEPSSMILLVTGMSVAGVRAMRKKRQQRQAFVLT